MSKIIDRFFAYWAKALLGKNFLKRIVDNAIDEFVQKERYGFFEKTHNEISALFSIFADDPSDMPVVVDHHATVLTVPFNTDTVVRYLGYLYESAPESYLYESVYYIAEHNFICYTDVGTHRLAALNLYYRKPNTPFALHENKVRHKKIDTEILKTYHFNKKGMVLYRVDLIDHSKIIDRVELSPLLYDILSSFQKYHFGKTNSLNKRMSDFYAALWENREKTQIERMRELLNQLR